MEAADDLLRICPEEIKTAFYELIYYPAYGTANLQRTWIDSSWNKFYCDQNRNTANSFCDRIDAGIKRDKKLIDDFHALDNGKFYGHALSQHFGFRFWNDSNNQLPTRLYVYPAYNKRMLVSKSDEMFYLDGREYDAEFIFAPSLPVNDSNSQIFGYSINGGKIMTSDTVLDGTRPIFNSPQWLTDNRRNAKCITALVKGLKGLNILRYYQLSANLILERIVLRSNQAEHRKSYLGPRESYRCRSELQ